MFMYRLKTTAGKAITKKERDGLTNNQDKKIISFDEIFKRPTMFIHEDIYVHVETEVSLKILSHD